MTDIQAIKDKLDIVAVLGEYIQLKKAGANWKACCPFHREKTPSFMVQPEKQIWHCFGCGKGGDIFTFIQEMEGLEFPEALKLLADRAGVKIDTYKSEIDKSQKNRILEVNAKAAYFFHRILLDMPASHGARDYLFQKRGLAKETAEEWQVGFIPEQWDLLTQYFLKKGVGIDDLVASGLTIKKDGAVAGSGKGYYDRFRGRIMFPIWDAHGGVVGFTGRVLLETENSGGKYVNTPQTIVYDKSRVLYGLNRAKTEIKAKDLAVIVEGQMDVIACHAHGMKNVIASSGTALTPEQVRLIKRYTNNVAMAFDADAAGQNAAKRGIDVALAEGLNIRVIRIPDGGGKDADECLKKNPQIWLDAVKNAQGIMEWYFASVFVKTDISDPKQKQNAANLLLAEIARIPYAVEQDHWLRKLSSRLDTDATILREEMKKVKKQPSQAFRADKATTPAVLSAGFTTARLDPHSLLLTELAALLLKFTDLYGYIRPELKPAFFAGTNLGGLYEAMEKQYNDNKHINIDTLRATTPGDSRENSIDILLLKAEKDFCDFSLEAARKEAQNILSRLRAEWAKKQRKEIMAAIATAEKAGEHENVINLLKDLQVLS